ncbi:MAG: c-type cytochrome [Dehalococcoidia bacterium]
MAVMISGVLIFSACGEAEEPPATMVPFSPTPAAPSTPTPDPGGEPTQTPQETPEPIDGDPVAGEALFTSATHACSTCHSTGTDTVLGPGLAGVEERAETRVPELSADEYLEQSLREPGAYVVDGFPAVMPTFAHLSDQELADLIAYLKEL